MKIQVRFRGLQTSSALHEYVLRRVRFALSRFSGVVTSVVVKISDINGPKGGLDKRCQVMVRGADLAPVAIEDLSADPYSAVDLAVERAARSASREIGRARDARREHILTGTS